jgi:hypothetical protein
MIGIPGKLPQLEKRFGYWDKDMPKDRSILVDKRLRKSQCAGQKSDDREAVDNRVAKHAISA